jgi:hypothetical protein
MRLLRSYSLGTTGSAPTPEIGDFDVKPDAWLYDPAHQACSQWIFSWRAAVGPEPPRPGAAFAGHLGGEALTLMESGMGLPEMLRLFAGSGAESTCVCGKDVS